MSISLATSKHTGSLPGALSRVLRATKTPFEANYGQDGLATDYHRTYNISEEDVASWEHQKNCIPRRGEVVLFVRGVPMTEPILLESAYSWEAGIVLYISSCSRIIRVMPCGDPTFGPYPIYNAATVSVDHTRPYFLYAQICNQDQLLSSVRYAAMYSTGISSHYPVKIMGGKMEDQATREPHVNAMIFVKAMGFGVEMLRVGDVVRVCPEHPDKPITKVLHVCRVLFCYTELLNWTAEHDRCQVVPRLVGIMYTMDPLQAASTASVKYTLPQVMQPYGPWYRVSKEPNMLFTNRVLSRLYEQNYLDGLFHSKSLSCGSRALLAARSVPGSPRSQSSPRWHTQQPKSMYGPQGWYMANNRSEALSLNTLEDVEPKQMSGEERMDGANAGSIGRNEMKPVPDEGKSKPVTGYASSIENGAKRQKLTVP